MRSFRTAQASHAHLLSDTTCLLNTVRCPEVKKKKKKKKKEYAAVNSACPEATHSEWKDAYSYSGEPRSFQLRIQGEAPRQAFAPVRGVFDVNRMLVRESDREKLVWSGWK